MTPRSQSSDSSHHSDYEEGLRDGRIRALEDIAAEHGKRLDNHDNDFKNVGEEFKEIRKMYFIIYGAIVMAAFVPQIKDVIESWLN